MARAVAEILAGILAEILAAATSIAANRLELRVRLGQAMLTLLPFLPEMLPEDVTGAGQGLMARHRCSLTLAGSPSISL